MTEGMAFEAALDGGAGPGVQRFRKRPVVIEAVRLVDDDGCDWDEIAKWCGGRIYNVDTMTEPETHIDIRTLEGTMTAIEGDWIIKGVAGEFYPCREDVFAATYEPVTDEAPDDPPLPAGEYARVEIMGHDYHTGWVTERDRAGVRVLAIADWDGRVLAEVPGQSLYRYVPLPTPLKRPEVAAITRANPDYDGDGWDSRDDDDLDDGDDEGPF